jgi:Chaperone of endosialidase
MKKSNSTLLKLVIFFCILLCNQAIAQKVKKPQKTNTSIYKAKVYAEKSSPQQFLLDQQKNIELQKSVADVVVPDDQIIQGSECVGFDCINNESFGFDTERLKENSTRIGFDDTSASAGFAANDWQLEANESASGGTNSFAILDVTGSKTPFKIIAGAPTNSFFVSSAGKIGLRTNTPVLDVHASTGDTPAIRLEQNGNSGFTAQTWDMGGNEANFFIRDITGGSRLPFRIRPGAPTSSIDIAASGNVGIGIISPLVRLHVVGDGYFTGNIYAKDAILPGASVPSDQRLKKEINSLKNASNLISLLSPKTFIYDTEKFPNLDLPVGIQYGLIAQEVEKVIPSFVREFTHPNAKSFKTVNYMGMIPILIQGMKEQQEEIERLKAKITNYEELNARLTRIEATLNKEAEGAKTDKK